FHARRAGGGIEFGLKVARQHINSNDVVHGGLLATMLDHLLGQNCVLLAENPAYVTSNLNVSYLRPVLLGDFVIGRATVYRTGRTAGYASGVLSVGDRAVA